MIGARHLVFIGMLAFSSGTALAADGTSVMAPSVFAKPIVFQGVLGGAPVQMQLRPKQEVGEGLEGHYFFFGHSQQILLAGEADQDQLFMEESVNGIDVSGSWAGTLEGDVVSGEWQAAGGGEIKAFRLEALRAQVHDAGARAQGRRPPSAQSRQ
jgi:hypothetical protein